MSRIYSYITEQESGFKTQIPLEQGWFWNMKDHIRRSFLYKNSQFKDDNENRKNRPYKNIIRPILNIHYRTEGFDVKDIEIFVDNSDTYYKSFLVKKYHEKWALKNGMDTFIDQLVESYVDYGGVLVKNTRNVRPEVVDLRTIAFCDQTDVLSGPFAIKHYFSPSQLREMSKRGWDKAEIEFLITKSEAKKVQDKDSGEAKTPGRYIEIYETHNVSEADMDLTSDNTERMVYICGLYTGEGNNTQGVTLFSNPEPTLPFKFLKRDPIQGRALGFGAIEELFEPQVWTNFAEIHIAGMLEHASKVYYKSTDPKFKDQVLTDNENGRVFDLQDGRDIAQIDNQPRNLVAFTNYATEMHEHAMEMGAASDLFLGQQPTSGTPFKSLETQLVEGKSLHVWRQGRISTFVDEIYRDWLIPNFGREITKGTKFLSVLSADEMITISETLARNGANKRVKEELFKGKVVYREQYEEMKQLAQQNFLNGGNKRFLEILKDEMSGEKLDVSTNIVGKQKDLALITDKLVNVLRQFIATPEIRQDPEMIKFLNSILESSGLSPIAYSPKLSTPQAQGGGPTQGLKALGESAKQEAQMV